MGLLIFPLNKGIRNENFIKSSERFLIMERGTPQRIKNSEERDDIRGILFLRCIFFFKHIRCTSKQKHGWWNDQTGTK